MVRLVREAANRVGAPLYPEQEDTHLLNARLSKRKVEAHLLRSLINRSG